MAAMAILWTFPGIAKDACAASRREKYAAVSPAPRHDQIVMKLPAGCKPVVVRGRKFFYHGGDFYQKAKGGFIIVNAPIGALVVNLPYGHTRHIHGGVAYVQYNGTYYRETAHGYTVVAATAVAEDRFQPPRGKTHRVSVSADPAECEVRPRHLFFGCPRGPPGQHSGGSGKCTGMGPCDDALGNSRMGDAEICHSGDNESTRLKKP